MANGNANGTVNCEQQLWQVANKLLNNMDAVEYKHAVLGIVIWKYISDAIRKINKGWQYEYGCSTSYL